MNVHLDPGSYVCPEHGGDLTGQVVEQLQERGVPAAMGPLTKRRPFAVAATCPATTARVSTRRSAAGSTGSPHARR